MKKFLTALCVLGIGSIGLTAYADTTNITPTISPEATIEVGEYWPTEIVINWDNEGLSLNTEDSNYDDGYIVGLNLYINGQQATNPDMGGDATLYAQAVEWSDQGTWGYWNTVETGTHILIGGMSYSYDQPSDGDYMEFTLPAGCIKIGDNDTNAELKIKFTVGEVEFDDTSVKTFGSSVEFTGPNTCKFITRLDDIANMCVVSNVDENLANYITMSYDAGLGGSPREYNFNTVKMSDGNYAYNFENVHYEEMTFTYSGNTEVTFTFQQEWEDGEQEGGLLMGDPISWGTPFQAGPTIGQKFMYTFEENYSDDTYIQVNTSTDVLNNGTLTVVNTGDMSVLGSWKTGSNFVQIAGPNGNYGYTGVLTMTEGSSIYVIYEGTEDITIQIGNGIYTENGVPTYMQPATVSPTTISVSNTTAGVELTWGDQEVTVREVPTMQIYLNGDVDGLTVELRNYMEFLSDEEGDIDSGDPDDPTDDDEVPETFAVGDSGNVILFKFGAALNNAPEVGTYTFTLPSGMVVNADGALNPKQLVTITVVSPTVGTVTPNDGEAGPEFEEGKDVVFTITFDGTPTINETEDEPVLITGETDAEYAENIAWEDGVVYVNENTVVVNLGNQMEPGAYYLNFRAGAVTVDGQENELIENFRFVINADENAENPEYLPVYPTVVPDPREDAVGPFESVTIEWTDYTLVLNENCEDDATFNGEVVTGEVENNVLVFNVDATADGQYTLVVPAQYVIGTDVDSNEYYNDTLRYIFVVDKETGVKVIGSTLNGNEAIYNLNGVKVNGNNVNKGIYIINGKKVIVK